MYTYGEVFYEFFDEFFWRVFDEIFDEIFLRFFTIISILADFERNNTTYLFVKYFCGFFIAKYLLDSNQGNQPLC